MSSFNLNEHHENCIVNYLRFASYQRNLRLKAVEACFQDVKSSRLLEDTYTADEVREMLDSLEVILRGEVESELLHLNHTNVLTLVQLFQQAEKWHLKLQPDISELENRELLENVKSFEDKMSGRTKGEGESKGRPKLLPVNETGPAALLKIEIERLNEDNQKLKERIKLIESQAVELQKDKSKLKSQLSGVMEDLKNKDEMTDKKPKASEEEIEDLRQKLSNMKADLERRSSIASENTGNMEVDLSSTKHELLKVHEMLELAEKELEKKVNQTAPFKNLMLMVQKKNDQIKELRKKLSEYETITN